MRKNDSFSDLASTSLPVAAVLLPLLLSPSFNIFLLTPGVFLRRDVPLSENPATILPPPPSLSAIF